MLKYLASITQLSERQAYDRWWSFHLYKKYFAFGELWVDKDFKMIGTEVKGRDPKYTGEIVCIYRAPNEDI
jgi:hypothetical protein